MRSLTETSGARREAGERHIQGLFTPGKLRVTGCGQSTHFGPVVLRQVDPREATSHPAKEVLDFEEQPLSGG